jgi:hypothetical protein
MKLPRPRSESVLADPMVAALPHRCRRCYEVAIGRDRYQCRTCGIRDAAEAWGGPDNDAVIGAPPTRTSEHLRLEIAAAHVQGHPLDPGEPVPGCTCELCIGLPADHPARIPAWRRADPDKAAASDRARRERWERTVDAVRAVSVIDIARLLGCGEPVRRGRTLHVRCPLHDDRNPSCRIDVDQNLWYCAPCGEGGDALVLYMRARCRTFTEAISDLAGAS